MIINVHKIKGIYLHAYIQTDRHKNKYTCTYIYSKKGDEFRVPGERTYQVYNEELYTVVSQP